MPDAVLLYTRQSISETRETLSLASQREVLERWCAQMGWVCLGEIRDPDEKGWDEDRPGLAEVVARCERGGIDAVAVWDLSRLARSLRIQENVLHRLYALGVEVRSYREPHAVQPLFRQILGAIAEEQTRTISANVRRALGSRAERGEWHGSAPWGYRRGGDRRLTPGDPATVAAVQRIFALAEEGLALTGIGPALAADGVASPTGGPWHYSTIRNILLNPAYTGTLCIGVVRVEGAHEPIVERAVWDRVQARMEAVWERAPRLGSTRTFLAGRARCGCGLKLYPARSRASGRVSLRCGSSGNGRERCAEPRRQVELHIAEAFVRARLAEDLAGAVPWREAVARAEAIHRAAAPGDAGARRDLERRRLRARTKRDRVDAAYFGGEVEAETWRRVRAEATAELAAVERAVAALPAPPDPAAFRQAAALVGSLAVAVAAADDDALARVLAALGGCFWLRQGAMALDYDPVVAELLGAPGGADKRSERP